MLVVVNGEPITEDAFHAAFRAASKGRTALPDDEAARLQVKGLFLSELVDRALLDQQARALGVTVSEAEIDARLAAIAKGYPTGEFNGALEDQKLDPDALRARVAAQLLVDGVVAKAIEPTINVEPSEAEAEYLFHQDLYRRPEQVRVSQILLATEIEAEGIVAQLYSGADFAALARERSIAPEAQKGGDLGFFSEGEMLPAVSQAAFNMAVGQTSGVLKSDFGYHVVRVTDRKPEHNIPFEAVRDSLREQIRRKKAQEGLQAYLDKVRAAADIRYNQGLMMEMTLP